ncbi:MAG: hypothetical protein WD403_12510 [Pirellulales bacterium]
MSLHADLLTQAEYLANKEPKRPKQASLRRAISAAYYAVKGVFPIPQEVQNVAKAFVDLQQARHDADYDLARSFPRSDALAFVEQAKQAFVDWRGVRKGDLARIYLACFLLWKQWDKAR